ncbi:gastrula zinc finger protein XlCGF57.1 isoform X2 [Diabrotica virgifera virgifera]|uniref:Gastrula zinc finger protein XlCGF57.1-like isoform X2 n=1 Tax=Diabrotica virgifera virgifera TaxID=50390 RepID=A0A6P7HJ51_DIAVI|nr:gastrula zinc finger protein XlCGF57.1 isoform X2 [Diabrotica virgifera virgifera]
MNLENKIINYKNTCRICLKTSENMKNLFTLIIHKDNTSAVEFIRKMTDLKLLYSDTLPSNICSECTQAVFTAFDFVEICLASDARLRTQETRRMLREIEAEALELEDEDPLKCDTPSELEHCSKQDELVKTGKSEERSQIIQEKVNPLPKELQFTTARIKDKYKCDVCKKKFNNKILFNKHKRIHEDNAFKCMTCSLSFSRKLNLKAHLTTHLENKDKKFECKECNKFFVFEYLLKKHELRHSNVKPFPCTSCDKGCLTAESLKRHMRTHDKNYTKCYTCYVCNKSFAYPSFLAEHMKNHTGEKPHICNVCGKGFRQSGALHFHEKIHTGDKPFPCRVCKENFMSRSQLTIHLRSHTGEKPFTCSTCNKSFASKTMLATHERIHTGEKPYTCKICDKSFSQSCTLLVHSKIHDKQTTKGRNNAKKEAGKENKIADTGKGNVMKKIADLKKNTLPLEKSQGGEFVVDDIIEIDDDKVNENLQSTSAATQEKNRSSVRPASNRSLPVLC